MSVHLAKITRIALAAAIAIGGAVGTAAISQPAAYAASASHSVIGDQITRSEVITRAQSWIGQNIPYDKGGSYPDAQGTSYRTDCSGYISMAWHLGTSATTQSLADSYTNPISRSDLKPGDILNSYYNHVILFEKWDDAAHSTFSYYSFGSTPVKHITGVSIDAPTFDSHPNSEYVALRYKNIVDGSAGTESGSGRVRFADWDGDGRADYIVVNDDGSVHVYLNRGGDGHGGWVDDGVVATGMTTDKSRVRFADWDGDSRADYIVINPDGKVHVMLNRGGDGHGGWQDAG
ncbi:FG-GAP-like repeat-containing protein, partial [Kitasatospora sp. NPDC056138]|uniref:C40 family peptidase n=1 Tax=Kitasatospora sp. NPDC056138 TaxID=3345724 RepID=UPI0035D7FC04